MPLTRAQKQKLVDEFKDWVSRGSFIVFTDHKGLKAQDALMLRRAIRAAGGAYRVVKKTLAKIALRDTRFAVSENAFGDQLGVVVSHDPANLDPLKAAHRFTKEHEQLKLIGGIFQEELLGREALMSLAELPSQMELRARFVGVISRPLADFVGVLAAPLRSFVTTLRLHSEK